MHPMALLPSLIGAISTFLVTECNLPVARPFDAPEEAGCSGKVWDDYFEVIIGDPDTDEELPVGEVGEILVRPKEPYCFMQGYNGMPEMTVETWRNQPKLDALISDYSF